MDYIITGLPRCRTAWLAVLMTYGSSFCSHELITVEGVAGAGQALARMPFKHKGVADSGAGWAWQLVLEKFPQSRVLRVLRPWQESAASHNRYFTENPLPGIETPPLAVTELLCQQLDQRLDAMKKAIPVNNYREVDYTDLENELTCRMVWEFLAPGEPFNSERWALLDKMRINLIPGKY